MKIKGSHGTTKNAYSRINTTGFEVSRGRCGDGVYFWREGPLYETLAEEWCLQCRKEKRYSSLTDELCTVFVTLSFSDERFFDFEDFTFRSKLYEMAIKRNVDIYKPGEFSSLFSLFIEIYQRANKVDVCVFQVRVAPPTPTKYPIKLMGAPMCLVVRDTNCIIIDSNEPFKELEND